MLEVVSPSLSIISDSQIIDRLNVQKNSFFEEYYAFYSSWYGGITKNPHLMLLPIDDHMVHRGDGVFEGIKAVGRSIYLLDEHLHRLIRSAEKIALTPPLSYETMQQIIVATLQAADKSEAMIRVYLSRGPGNFTVNPYDSIGAQFYVLVTRLTHPPEKKYTEGVKMGKSIIPIKPSFLAQTKSCNYLPNVMMKKEAVDRGLDFVIGLDAEGYIAESATENVMIVDQNGVIVHPILDNILKGTTMTRACELARENGLPTAVRPISLTELSSVREVMFAGTTLDILPVVEFEGQKIGNGKPGPIAMKLHELIVQDIRRGIRGVSF